MAPSGFSVLDATVVSEAKRHSNTGIELLCPGTARLGVLQPGFMGMAKGQNVQFWAAHIMVSGNRINYTADVNSLQLCQRYGSLQ
uniref:Uncharacterized protein n=1 Tax=Vitis vinifera TaxID=29760 RepID=F6H5C5_VITVI